MAKRQTIGENPLDTIMTESPLDSVLPRAGLQAEKSKEEDTREIQKRLDELEAEVKDLKKQISQLRAETMEMQRQMPPSESKWVARLREKLAGK